MLIDTHAHIYLKQFKEDIDEVMQRSHDEGIQKILMPNIDVTSIEGMLNMEAAYPGVCYSMMGLHPCSVGADFEKQLATIEEYLNKREYIAIGEIGTDLYWDKTYWPQQQEAFVIQLDWAKTRELPVVIHCRDSMDETLDMVEARVDNRLTGVFHCFGGSLEQARRIIEMGFYLGIGGVSTYKNSEVDQVVKTVGLDRVVLETDSPYLAPVPKRGKRNEPLYVKYVCEHLASMLECSAEEVSGKTTLNARKLFHL
ncbi:MAG: TatD family hydrolase [Cyclobacteriaceae bacterium]|nr:TatD family hydrolase [Cyclobacteriaceae bacterium]